MKILINDDVEIGAIQKMFNKDFPYLRLGFFKAGSGEGRIFTRSNQVLDYGVKVGQLSLLYHAGYWNVRPGQRTGDLEKDFLKKFGLYIQVFRRSGNAWIETSSSDDMTLDEQNRKGSESTLKPGNDVAIDMDLYHEQL